MSDALSDASSTRNKDQHANVQAAVARTLTRSFALYFSRPVRLFRPSKVSGWQTLRSLATQHGASLTPHYVFTLVKAQGFVVIPKHFLPPMLVNAALGTVLWTTYSQVAAILESNIGKHHPVFSAAIGGALAGGMQALVAAPAENVRLILEGGSGGASWSKAWKEVFLGTKSMTNTRRDDIEDIRQLRTWMKEVGDMAGRGWNGWGWGVGKDMAGFAVFFALFEITRSIALEARAKSEQMLSVWNARKGNDISWGHSYPRMFHGMTLIAGGVVAGLAYESVSTPWDIARHTVHIHRLTRDGKDLAILSILRQKLHDNGISSFFVHAQSHIKRQDEGQCRRRMVTVARALGRVGPWGVGFLVWEAYGGGLS